MSLTIDPKQVRPYYDALGDGMIQVSFSLPLPSGPQAHAVAMETLRQMQLGDIAIVQEESIDEGFTFFIAYARVSFSVDSTMLSDQPEASRVWSEKSLVRAVEQEIDRPLVLVGATLESDAHTVGLDAILNPKGYGGHPGLEHYSCFRVINLGAQVAYRRLLDVLVEEEAEVLLISQTITQKDFHLKNLTRLMDLLEAERLRDGLITLIGGPSITAHLAQELGFDAGFGRGTRPAEVAGFIVAEFLRRRSSQ